MLINAGKNYKFITHHFSNTRRILNEEKKTGKILPKVLGVGLEGASRCFVKDTKVIMHDNSTKKIQDVKSGDLVKSYNKYSRKEEIKRCTKNNRFTSNKKKLIRIKLKNGNVLCGTEDHKIWFKDNWICLKDFVILLDEKRKLESNP